MRGMRAERASARDAYYTREPIARECVESALAEGGRTDGWWVEPTAGAGAFVDALVNAGVPKERILRCDIRPGREDIDPFDFLGADEAALDAWIQPTGSTDVHVLGNPPFGRQSVWAKQCIRQCARFATRISFVLPRSFEKPNLHRAFPLHWHLRASARLPDDSFTWKGKIVRVPCVFQTWEKRCMPRVVPSLPVPHGFSFVRPDQNPDLAIRRVGHYAGRTTTHADETCPSSHTYVRLDPDARARAPEIASRLDPSWFPRADATVGSRSISQADIVTALNPVILSFCGIG